MNNYRLRQKPTFEPRITPGMRRTAIALIIVLAIAAGTFGYLYLSNVNMRSAAHTLFARRIDSNLVDAISQVNRLSGGVQSNSFIKISQIRQHIYAMDQINSISVALLGEAGRFIPPEAIQALFSDLDRYEVTIQTATGNTLEDRTLLLTHLTALQAAMGG
ncbi:MAG TPA: hypothetical protein VLA21_12155 [Candidatus Limnocylindria bacterium]|nr:hypothetical protein [Candidatus Limnocylindria bacterium]